MKRTVGFPISIKENEFRRAIIPNDLKRISNCSLLYFQHGYGNVLGYSDDDYLSYGVHMVSRDETLQQDIICDPKIGDADYLSLLNNQIIFGWVHAVQNRDITDCIMKQNLTAYAWEDMFEGGRHVFWRNNEIAGEAAVMHAFQCYGEMPYSVKAAVMGRGNTANGAIKILTMLGAEVFVYNRNMENLFREELSNYDVIVNAVLWDTSRKDHIVYETDLKRMKKNAMIIDISCDKAGAIESSIPTTIEKPIYTNNGVVHYVVDHTPSLFYKTASVGISDVCCKYIDILSDDRQNDVLEKAKCIERGIIVDKRIKDFQNR